jgi:transcriptional regulator NrdR family protein
MDSAYEDMCVELRKRMTTAQEQDVASRLRGEPAMAKLSMLDEVMSVLRKYVAGPASIHKS